MDIKANSLYAQMQAMSLEATGRPAMDTQQVAPASSSGSEFGQMLSRAVNTVNDLQQDSAAKKTAFEMGDKSVTLAETMIASQKAGVAFEATVQVRNKLVEAYKEVMNMPV